MICALTETTRLVLCIYFSPPLFLSDLSTGRHLALEKAKGIYKIKFLNSSFFWLCSSWEMCCTCSRRVWTQHCSETMQSFQPFIPCTNTSSIPPDPLGERLFVSLCAVIAPTHLCILALVSIHNQWRKSGKKSLSVTVRENKGDSAVCAMNNAECTCLWDMQITLRTLSLAGHAVSSCSIKGTCSREGGREGCRGSSLNQLSPPKKRTTAKAFTPVAVSHVAEQITRRRRMAFRVRHFHPPLKAEKTYH